MADISSINTATITGSSNTTKQGLNTLSSSDFMKLMIQQLQHQDPLNPTDSNQMLSQISQISSLQSNTQMQQSLTSLTLQQSIGAGGNLVGKAVTGLTSAGAQVTGTVANVQVANGAVFLGVTDSAGNINSIPMSNVTEIDNTAQTDSSLVQQGLQSVALQQSLANSGSLLGKYVTAAGTGNSTITGTVTGVQLMNQNIFLTLDSGKTIPAATVTQFSAQPPVIPPVNNTSSNTTNPSNTTLTSADDIVGKLIDGMNVVSSVIAA